MKGKGTTDLKDQELPWSEESTLEKLIRAESLLGVRSVSIHLAGELGELVRSCAEQIRRIGLGREQYEDKGEDSSKDGEKALDPSPAGGETEEATGDGSKRWAEEWRSWMTSRSASGSGDTGWDGQ